MYGSGQRWNTVMNNSPGSQWQDGRTSQVTQLIKQVRVQKDRKNIGNQDLQLFSRKTGSRKRVRLNSAPPQPPGFAVWYVCAQNLKSAAPIYTQSRKLIVNQIFCNITVLNCMDLMNLWKMLISVKVEDTLIWSHIC